MAQLYKEFLIPIAVFVGTVILCMISDLIVSPFFKGGLFGMFILVCLYLAKKIT